LLLSMRWLGDYIKFDATPKQFSDAMTMTGSKVEGWSVEGSEISGVVVGRIDTIHPHPNAENLLVCLIDTGDETLSVVTGAKNIKSGDLVPVALEGAVLPGQKVIGRTAFKDVESRGMLCSLAELGLDIHDFPHADEEGIFVLEESQAPGTTIQEALGFNDTVFEFEITSNRPDCLSVLGLAREAGATFGVPFTPPSPTPSAGGGDIEDLICVRIDSPSLCPRYVARAVTGVKIAPSPRWLRERLRAGGIRPINNIVDITNFVMLEYGQPMHAFDIRHIDGRKIIVRNAAPGEVLTTLDEAVHRLSSEMLVIADANKPLALAGVMGGAMSGIQSDTTDVIFESANFLHSSVRSTSRKVGLRTESSSRFEKGLDPLMCRTAADRACELAELIGAGKAVAGCVDENFSESKIVRIGLEHEWINSFLGLDITREKMEDTLRSLEFSVEGDVVTPPSFRYDVRHKADIAEEVARFYGYDKIPSNPLHGSVYGAVTPLQRRESFAADCLTSQGFFEVLTYTFLSPKDFDRILLPKESSLRNCVTILNPLGEDTGFLRTVVYPSMLSALSRNFNNRNAKARLFEIAKEFLPSGKPLEELPAEVQVISLGMYGKDENFFTMKGAVETLLNMFGISDYNVVALKDNFSFHPGRCAAIEKDGRHIAALGEVHPLVCAEYEISTRVMLARIEISALFDLDNLDLRTYKPLPRFPASLRDLSVVCNEDLPVQTVQRVLKESIGDILRQSTLFDCYRGRQIPPGKKSLSFSLSLRADDRTLNESEIAQAMKRCLEALEQLGAQLRAM
jgi:phenylalanyl-tRNA synthetase beta chain